MGRYLRGLLFGVVLVGVLVSMGACGIGPRRFVNGSGAVRSEARAVRDFTGVDLSGTGTLVITQGATEALTIEAEDNILAVLTSEVRGDTLRLGVEEGVSIRPTKPIRYTLAVKNLDDVKLSGSGRIEIGALRTERLAVRISGSGDATIGGLSATTLAVTVSGSGDIEAAGTVTRQEISISGSGAYAAEGLASREARVSASGNGRATVRVADTLDVQISGSGDIAYIGTPRVATDISGAGKVNRLAER
jgi:hypothetical protein